MNTSRVVIPKHIAVLFGLIAKEVVNRFNEDGKAALSAAIDRFGRDRGRRISEKVAADGLPLSIVSYSAYSDICSRDHKTKIFQRKPFVKIAVTKCGWHEAWIEYNLLEFGRIYCQIIDAAIMKGFNPQSRFEVKGLLTDGKSKRCTFCYYNEVIKITDFFKFVWIAIKSKRKHGSLKVPISSHLSELVKLLDEELEARFGDAGKETVQRAVAIYKRTFSTAGSMEKSIIYTDSL